MPTSDLAGALQDVRKMKRSISLRNEDDSEVVSETLTTILREALAVRSASDGRLGKGAVNELRNIRKAMVAGQINPGQRTGEFIGKYSAILDQIGDVEKTSKKDSQKEGPGVGASIASNLPSADMITSALITANPILGYTTKIAKDIFSSSNKRRKTQREIEHQRLENLEKEERKLEEQEREAKEEKQLEETSDQSETQNYEQELITGKLDLIREEIQKLVAIWTDGDEKLERIVEETEETNRLEKESESKSDLMSSELSYENSSFGAGSLNGMAANDAENAFDEAFDGRQGLFAGIGGALGGIGSALVTKLMAPFVGLINFIKGGGTILRGLGRFTLILSAVYSIYDFVDGFMSAGDILDKKESEISVTDKIRAGGASVIAGLLSPVDWVLDFMGMGFMDDKTSFTKKLANSESELLQFFLSPGAWIIDYVKDFDWTETYDQIKDSIGGAIESIGDKFSEIGEAIESWFQDKIDWFYDTTFGKQVKKAIDIMTSENELTRAIDNDVYYGGGMMGNQRALDERNERDPIVIDIERPENRISETPNTVSQAVSQVVEEYERGANTKQKEGDTTIVAPNNSSSNTINNNTISSGSGSQDLDRTWRQMLNSQGQMTMP